MLKILLGIVFGFMVLMALWILALESVALYIQIAERVEEYKRERKKEKGGK